ncbi:Protein argonaute MEL1 [Folsomia candida]|uniref:Protein argonaute MEL1 n=1 Tax=Folsomia candida TaxID=158441 RepID=A0A226DQG2_FOLCA|nr:Protein argonaute MEL1 [Folsomia candida]
MAASKEVVVVTSPRPLRVKGEAPLHTKKKISLIANHYPVWISGGGTPTKRLKSTWRRQQSYENTSFVTLQENFPEEIYQYDVVIANVDINGNPGGGGDAAKKTEIPARVVSEIWKEFEKQNQAVLTWKVPFDGRKIVFTAGKLDFPNGDAYSVTLEMADPDDPDKRRRFKRPTEAKSGRVRLLIFSNRRGTVGGLSQTAVQGLDVALRHAPSFNYISCNHSFFNESPKKRIPLIGEDGKDWMLELLQGHYQSLCLGSEERATLNIDLASKAFYKKMSLAEYVGKACNLAENDSFDLDAWDEWYIEVATEALKGIN